MTPLIFLHGALGAASQFAPLIAQLNNDRPMSAIDLPQHGMNSDIVAPNLESYAYYLLSILEQNHREPVDLFGYSMGGYLALMMAAQRPDLIRRVMTAATKFDWQPESGQKQINMLNAEVMETKVPAYTAYLNSLHEVTHWKDVVGMTRQILSSLVAQPPLQDAVLQGIQQPCRIGRGELDTMVSEEESRRAAALMPEAEFFQLAQTPHPLEKMDAQILAGACRDFFTD